MLPDFIVPHAREREREREMLPGTNLVCDLSALYNPRPYNIPLITLYVTHFAQTIAVVRPREIKIKNFREYLAR